MRKDLRPYWVKRSYLRFRYLYTEYFLRPEFASLGDHHVFMQPWHTIISGDNIHMGHSATVVAEPDNKVRIGVWGRAPGLGSIRIGNAAMISPGVRISASDSIVIGHGCMLANGVYITDSDWHDIYDRTQRSTEARPVEIGDNVWIGDHATVLKGVTIGDNSIVAAASVVTKAVPPNVIVAGNPARVVKTLDEAHGFQTRTQYFANPEALNQEIDTIDRLALSGNSFWRWISSLIFRNNCR